MAVVMIALALVVAAFLIVEIPGRKRRSPGSRWTGSGLIIVLLMNAIIQLSNDHNWPYHQKHALHELALIPMIMALALVTVGTVRQIQAKSRRSGSLLPAVRLAPTGDPTGSTDRLHFAHEWKIARRALVASRHPANTSVAAENPPASLVLCHRERARIGWVSTDRRRSLLSPGNRRRRCLLRLRHWRSGELPAVPSARRSRRC
jgi:hypothetical protein